ncbi:MULTISPECIES: ABC transporter substrate-binding protein [unclassified Cupriavidus]|uniref:ABC transporter substrate-binding protein n=1 Tax=unclassified Cupriavidus TaxID=2640874 RepID=UPI0010541D7F|nr:MULTISPECIES: ABC transporter substrate-binding protein [unclassified Cupriavidus]MBF6989132.1 ABC transporter substrate-binding protein [Cupriavidus sp. IK-TO18]TDF61927.1 transporter substrate-binding domain-containing protein [Cupriavidus sp. L7L]
MALHPQLSRRLRLFLLGIGVALTGTAHADRLADIKARGTLICGTLSTSQPLGYQDPKTRQIVGFDVETCAAVAKHLGVKLEHRPLSVESRIPELALGRVDIVAAALGYTKERARQIAFSDIHYQVPIKLVVPVDSSIKDVSQAKDIKISTVKGSTPELYARRLLQSAEIVTFQDSPTAFLALQQGKAQAFAIAQMSGARYVNESSGKMRFVDGQLHWEPTALGVKKGEPALLAAVNTALAKMEKEGELDAMWNKWAGPQTPFNIKREKKLTPLSAVE